MDPAFGGNDRIPFVAVSRTTGAALKANLAAGVGVRFDRALLQANRVVESGWEDMLADFSARGPRQGDSALRPDVAAPGITVVTAKSGSGTQATSFNGTSCAAPHAAGAMALLRQLRPAWSNDELKALLMSTATHDLYSAPSRTPPRYGLSRIGAGRIDLASAAGSQLVAFDDERPSRVSVSFGVVDVAGTASIGRFVRVVNKGAAPAQVALSYQAVTDVPGVRFDLPGGSPLAVPAGGTAVFPVVLTADAAQMKHTRDATVPSRQDGFLRHWVSEHAGYIVLAPTNGPVLRLPVHAAPRPASRLAAAVDRLVVAGDTGTFPLPIAGQGVFTGTAYPLDERSWFMPFELQAASTDDPASTGLLDASDLRWVGVASNAKQKIAQGKTVADAKVWFGVATHGPWSTPNSQGVSVFVDTDLDGTDDFVVFTGWIGANGAGGSTNPTDAFVAWTCELGSPTCRADAWLNDWSANIDTVPFNTNVLYLTASASTLRLTDGHSRFSYWVRTTTWWGVPVDATGRMTYDPAHPGLDFGGTPYFDGPWDMPVGWDRASYHANGSLGVLMFHHHNAGDTKAEAVRVEEARPARRALRRVTP